MDESQLRTIEQIDQFLIASADVAFTAHGGDMERYAHISRVLQRFDYPRCSKHDRGVLVRYLQHTSGYSRAQVTRLVGRWESNRLAKLPLAKRYKAPAAPFARKYTALNIERLVEMDKAHEDVCGPATANGLHGIMYVRKAGSRVLLMLGSPSIAPANPNAFGPTTRQWTRSPC